MIAPANWSHSNQAQRYFSQTLNQLTASKNKKKLARKKNSNTHAENAMVRME